MGSRQRIELFCFLLLYFRENVVSCAWRSIVSILKDSQLWPGVLPRPRSTYQLNCLSEQRDVNCNEQHWTISGTVCDGGQKEEVKGAKNTLQKTLLHSTLLLLCSWLDLQSCTLANRTQIDMTKTSKGKQHFYGLIHFKKSITWWCRKHELI